jgi:hypothetical protein
MYSIDFLHTARVVEKLARLLGDPEEIKTSIPFKGMIANVSML